MATGVLNDMDHLYDFYRWYVRGDRERVYLWFHAWEYSLVGLVLVLTVWDHPIFIGAVVGHIGHMMGDQIGNRPKYPLTYSIIYRALKRFRHESLFQGELRDLSETLEHNIPLWRFIEPRVKPYIPWL